MQTPSPMAARRLFRASLVHLPLFMAGMALHRIPQTEEHRSTQRIITSLRLGSSAPLAPAVAACAQVPVSRAPILGAISVAPFPFLPVPLQLRCPSRVACEPGSAPSQEVFSSEGQVKRVCAKTEGSV